MTFLHSYFRNFIFRMGVIFTLASVIFVVGKIYNFVNPPSANAERHGAEVALSSAPVLQASLYDPSMQLALAQLRASGELEGSAGEGARLTFPSPTGSVVLSRRDVAWLNEYHMRLQAERNAPKMATSEKQENLFERQDLDEGGWGKSTRY